MNRDGCLARHVGGKLNRGVSKAIGEPIVDWDVEHEPILRVPRECVSLLERQTPRGLLEFLEQTTVHRLRSRDDQPLAGLVPDRRGRYSGAIGDSGDGIGGGLFVGSIC